MDPLNLVRSIVTVLSLLAFAGIVWWAFGPSRKSRFEEAAHLPFVEDDVSRRT